MTGETRRQRRDARRAQGESAAAPRTGGDAAPATAPAPVSTSEPGGSFIQQSWAELRKVDWPNRSQVIQGTIVVMIACAVVGAYLWGLDQVIRPFVRDVLIG